LQELRGIADGLAIPLERAVAEFSNGRLRYPKMGCSAVMASRIYGRNYDFSIRRYDGVLTAVQPHGVYASIGFSDRFTGRLDGMNEHGLCVGLHFVNEAIGRPGLVCLLLVRLVLDQCATTAEAVALLRRLPHGLGFNYSLIDATGEAAVVEATPAALEVRDGQWLACTNHFQAPALQPYNRRATGHSRRRLPALETWAARGLPAETLFRALNESTSPAFHHAYHRAFGTLHTIVCEPASRTMLIGIGGDAVPTRVDVAAWARGAPLPVTDLKGTVGRLAVASRR
jgi:predicted choloylglycine hydrolase